MKKTEVKILRRNAKGNAIECSLNNKTFWIQKRSLGANNLVSDKVIAKSLAFAKNFEKQKEIENQTVKFTTISNTEKAVKAEAILTCPTTDQQRKRTFFIPKSILQNGNMPAWFANKKRKELNNLESYSGILIVKFI